MPLVVLVDTVFVVIICLLRLLTSKAYIRVVRRIIEHLMTAVAFEGREGVSTYLLRLLLVRFPLWGHIRQSHSPAIQVLTRPTIAFHRRRRQVDNSRSMARSTR